MIDRWMERIAWGLSIVGCLVLLMILIVTIADVIADKLLGRPFPGATELTMSIMPISVCAFLLSVQVKKRHIVIDLLVNRLSPKKRVALQLLTQPCGLFLFGLLTWLTIPMAIHSVRIGEHTGGNVGVPMYPAKVMIPIATGLVAIQILIELVRTLGHLKQPPQVEEKTCEIIDDTEA
jgi:TRAP-type C4-dicarboxylate transport system permease small subunit